MICLDLRARIKHCCVYTHKKCQKRWGSACIICKKNTGIFTRQRYIFEYEPETTPEEIEEQARLLQEIRRLNDIRMSLEYQSAMRIVRMALSDIPEENLIMDEEL